MWFKVCLALFIGLVAAGVAINLWDLWATHRAHKKRTRDEPPPSYSEATSTQPVAP